MTTRPLLALLALPLAGCISFAPKPPPFLLSLAPAQSVPAGQTRSAGPGQAITVYMPSTPSDLATVRVPVLSAGNQVTYLKDAQWTAAPARLFQDLLSTTAAARTGRVVLNPRQASIDPGIRLSGELERFGYDATARAAVVSFDAIRQSGDVARVDNRRFEARVSVATADPASVAAGLNSAANEVAAQVSDWLVQ